MITDVLLFWNKKAVEIFNLHSSPPHDARRFAVIHIVFHNVLNSVNEKYNRYAYTQPVVKNASVVAAINSAAKDVLIWAVKDFRKFVEALPADVASPLKTSFSDAIANNHIANIMSLYEGQMASLIVHNQHTADGIKLGHAVVTAITTLRDDNDGSIPIHMTSPLNDGTDQYKFRGNYYYPPYPPPSEKLIVYYKDVIPFVIDNNSMFHQPFVPSNDSEIKDVEDHGTKTYVEDKDVVSIDRKDKIDYWSDLRQHVLLNNFTLKLIKASSMTDAWEIARILALIHTAMADGTIAVFRVLYDHYHWRPSTAINAKTGVPPLAPGSWKPYLPVPRVPEFPTVFGVFSGIVGVILEDNFPGFSGSVILDHIRPDQTHTQIVYSSINVAVKDNADTKVNCGWNFQSTIAKSFTQGVQIGQYVNSKAFTIFIPKLKRIPKWRLIFDKSVSYMKSIFKKFI